MLHNKWGDYRLWLCLGHVMVREGQYFNRVVEDKLRKLNFEGEEWTSYWNSWKSIRAETTASASKGPEVRKSSKEACGWNAEERLEGSSGRGQVTQGHGKELGFYPKSDRTPLKGYCGALCHLSYPWMITGSCGEWVGEGRRQGSWKITPGAPSVRPSRDDGGVHLEMAERNGECKWYVWVRGSSLDLLVDWTRSWGKDWGHRLHWLSGFWWHFRRWGKPGMEWACSIKSRAQPDHVTLGMSVSHVGISGSSWTLRARSFGKGLV